MDSWRFSKENCGEEPGPGRVGAGAQPQTLSQAQLLLLLLLLAHYIQVSVLPHALAQLDGTRTHIFPIHLTHGAHVVTGVLKANEAIALCLARAFVADHLSLKEGWETTEGACQDVIVHLIAQISTEDPEVIWGWERGGQRMQMPSPVSALFKRPYFLWRHPQALLLYPQQSVEAPLVITANICVVFTLC